MMKTADRRRGQSGTKHRNREGAPGPMNRMTRNQAPSGGYLGFDPDDNPVIWTAEEYAAKPGWGARLPSTFRTYGTPPLGAPEESVTADWPAPPRETLTG